MLAALMAGAVLAGPAFDFHTFGPYDPSIPTPESLLGYRIGARHTVYADQDKVVRSIAKAAPDRVRVIEFGKSTEGRTLRLLAISSPEIMARLDEIQAAQNQLFDPTKLKNPEEILAKVPAIVWVNQCIHGDETASFESAMELAYTLAASRSRDVNHFLANTLVLLNPSYNPDGHERYVVAYNSVPGGGEEANGFDHSLPSAFYGRANHYRFDMNRDRVAMSQAETRQEVSEFLKWTPHVYVDQHGQVSSYFFPPVQQSVNVNADRKRYGHWTDVFGRATSAAFDRQGWTYFVRDQFDFYNPCYLDTHASLMGSIGMTHETDGGRYVATHRSDGTMLTLLDGAAKHFTSALAVIRSASENRDELLKNWLEYRNQGATGRHAGDFKRVILTSEDPRPLKRLAEHLGRTGISVKWTRTAFKQGRAHDYWSDKKGTIEVPAGSLVVETAQPLGQLAKTLLEPGSDFEPEFIARQKAKAKNDKDQKRDPEIDDFEFYDSTAWSLPYAYNLKAWWAESTPDFAVGEAPGLKGDWGASTVGYTLHYSDQADILFVAEALRKGLKASMTTRAIQAGGAAFSEGDFFFLAARNEPGYEKTLRDLAEERGISLAPISTSYPDAGRYGPGSGSMVQLTRPKIGIVFGATGNVGGGSLWYLMEQVFHLPYTGINARGLDVSPSDFTCLVVPDGVWGLDAGKLKSYIEKGGVVVSLGDPGLLLGDGKVAKLETRSGSASLPGSYFRASLDSSSWLSYGYGGAKEISVPIEGSEFILAPEAGSAVSLSKDEKAVKLLTGWAWDETEKDLRGVSWLHDAPYGQGRAVVFSQDPSFRAQIPGLWKLLLNSMILGPSLGR